MGGPLKNNPFMASPSTITVLNGNACVEVNGAASLPVKSKGSCLCGYQQDLQHSNSQISCLDPDLSDLLNREGSEIFNSAANEMVI